MSRGLIRSLPVISVAALIVFQGIPDVSASASNPETALPAVLQRFLSLDSSPTAYRALRRMDARNQHLNQAAWMDVWTESDRIGGFGYTVVGQGGSGYIRSKIFLASLEMEKKMYESGAPGRAALTPENYLFEEGAVADGLSAVAVTPRRKDILLIDGSIFLRPEDGDLVRIEGRLSKTPSFWIRHVQVVRSYQRIAGARMPVAVEAVANIRLAGKATFKMTYEYETVNGRRIGAPAPRLAKAVATD